MTKYYLSIKCRNQAISGKKSHRTCCTAVHLTSYKPVKKIRVNPILMGFLPQEGGKTGMTNAHSKTAKNRSVSRPISVLKDNLSMGL
jgi:hypothetical protein